MKKPFFLCSVLFLAAMMSGCTSQRLIVLRDIAAGEVIQNDDLRPLYPSGVGLDSENWGWADVSDRPRIIGHKAKNALGTGWCFRMSEIDR
jgi:hypothetical protein